MGAWLIAGREDASGGEVLKSARVDRGSTSNAVAAAGLDVLDLVAAAFLGFFASSMSWIASSRSLTSKSSALALLAGTGLVGAVSASASAALRFLDAVIGAGAPFATDAALLVGRAREVLGAMMN